MSNYTERFKAITSLEELYKFRDELTKDAKDNSGALNGDKIDHEKLDACQDAHWYKSRVEERIKHLASEGVFLDSIPAKKEEPKS